MRRLPAVLAVVLAVVPARAWAQMCRGAPADNFMARGLYDSEKTLGAELGGLLLHHFLGVRFDKPQDQPNGSKTISYSLRYAYTLDTGRFGMCALLAGVRGYGHLRNAEGLNTNARLTSSAVVAALPLAARLPLTNKLALIGFVVPQAAFTTFSFDFYDRTGSTSGS